MPAHRITKTRSEGTCAVDKTHRIEAGDRVITSVYFPSDELVRDFGVKPMIRFRRCVSCTGEKLRDYARTGHLGLFEGLTAEDLAAHSIDTTGT